MIENQILSNLLKREGYARKVLPFIELDYFNNSEQKYLFKKIHKYVEEYNTLPTKEALAIEVSGDNKLAEQDYNKVVELLSSLDSDSETNEEWLVDQTEKFCQEKAIYNAIMESISIIDGESKDKAKDGIPQILSDALGVSFDSNVGHDFISDHEKRYEFYHQKEERLPFDIDMLNKITKGGLPRKTLNVILAGCVHPDTKVRVRVNSEREKEIPIGDIDNLLKEGYEVQVDSPDGYVDVNFFIDKGEWEEYVLTVDRDDIDPIRCNENHLFETDTGWKYAKDLANVEKCSVLTKYGTLIGRVERTGKMIPIVDINVNHENHRYYTNDVSSHNTGVGKSLFMCHMAANNLMDGKNVLYLTMEMAEERIAERIDANLMNVNLDDIERMSKDMYTKKIKAIREKTPGNLIVKEYPTASAHAGHFRHLINELKMKRKFVPDIIYVDYLNICASSRMKTLGGTINSYTFIKSIAEELRGLAIEKNVPLITATQTTRTGFGSSDLGLEDTSECIYVEEEVTLRDGQVKKIKDVKFGDQIKANDDYKTVMKVHHPKMKDCVKIKLKSGKEIIVSRDHIFPTDKGRLCVNTGLNVGHKLSSI